MHATVTVRAGMLSRVSWLTLTVISRISTPRTAGAKTQTTVIGSSEYPITPNVCENETSAYQCCKRAETTIIRTGF